MLSISAQLFAKEMLKMMMKIIVLILFLCTTNPSRTNAYILISLQLSQAKDCNWLKMLIALKFF